jgi:hypothetical protein
MSRDSRGYLNGLASYLPSYLVLALYPTGGVWVGIVAKGVLSSVQLNFDPITEILSMK